MRGAKAADSGKNGNSSNSSSGSPGPKGSRIDRKGGNKKKQDVPVTATSAPPTTINEELSSLLLTTMSIPFPTYLDGSHYTWTQTDSQLIISTRILPNTMKSDIKLQFTKDTITISIAREPSPRIKGKLFGMVDPDHGVTFTLEDLPPITPEQPNPYRVLLLRIHKLQQDGASTKWPLPIVSGVSNPIDVDSHSLYLLASALHDSTANPPVTQTAPAPTKALQMMIAAAEAGSVAAQLKLAAWYELGHLEPGVGIPVEKNLKKSLEWHRRAGLQGNSEACYIVMTAHATGSHGVKLSFRDAIEWARRSILSGYGDRIMAIEQKDLFIAVVFRAGLIAMEGGNGFGDPDPAMAAGFWQMSSALGHAQSSWNLGIFSINGFGIPVDIREGIELIQKGMSTVKELGLPPQLQGLTEADLDRVIEVAEEMEENSEDPVTIDAVVQVVKDEKAGTTTSTSSNKKSKNKKNKKKSNKKKSVKFSSEALDEAGDDMDDSEDTASLPLESILWTERARKVAALAMVAVGLWGIWRLSKNN